MPEQPFTNREIKEKWNDIANSLSRIEIQTTMHNGRMTKMERWQAYMSGGMAVIVLLIVPLLGWALYKLANIDSSIQRSTHQAVDETLSAYDIK